MFRSVFETPGGDGVAVGIIHLPRRPIPVFFYKRTLLLLLLIMMIMMIMIVAVPKSVCQSAERLQGLFWFRFCVILFFSHLFWLSGQGSAG